jgi:hypothetical protein
MVLALITPRGRRGRHILIGGSESVKEEEREFSRFRINHRLLSTPTIRNPSVTRRRVTLPFYMFYSSLSSLFSFLFIYIFTNSFLIEILCYTALLGQPACYRDQGLSLALRRHPPLPGASPDPTLPLRGLEKLDKTREKEERG